MKPSIPVDSSDLGGGHWRSSELCVHEITWDHDMITDFFSQL